MFKIIIKDLKLYGYHGVNPEEKTNGQDFLFNVKLSLSEQAVRAGDYYKDDLAETVNYSEIISIIKEINSSSKYDLLEALSGKMADEILSYSPLIDRVSIKVEKVNPPVKEDIGSVGVKCSIEKKSITRVLQFYLSIGSNMGDREKNIRDAVRMLGEKKPVNILRVSSIYKTEPMYLKEQQDFYNIVLEGSVSDGFGPFEMLGFLKSIEYYLGRKGAGIRFGPRVIDLDLLYYGELEIVSDILVLPHPRLKERNFVLVPLAEISPGIIIEGIIIKDFIKSCSFKESVKIISSW